MDQNKELKWEKEIEEILLKTEFTSGKPDMKVTSILGDIKDEGRTLDQLKEYWGDLSCREQPKNYRESHRILKKDYDTFIQASRRSLNRYKRTRHMLEIDAPSIIIDNEKRMLCEAARYLYWVANSFSGKFLLEGYRPPKRHSDTYYRWLKSQLKIENCSPEDALCFFISFFIRGKIAFREHKDNTELLFYFPKGEEPKGWEGKVLCYGRK